jgi:ketosteroid isomerase-like protein
MSQENVEAVQRFNDAFTRGDWDAVAANLDPDLLIRTDPRWPEQRFSGREAVMTWFRGAWESMGPDVRIEEIVDLGDRVLARSCWLIRGQHSEAEGEMRFSQIYTYREGRAVFIEYFLDHAEALKAVGLED